MHSSILLVAPMSEKRQFFYDVLNIAGFTINCYSQIDDIIEAVWNDPPAIILLQNTFEDKSIVEFVSELRTHSMVHVALLVDSFDENGVTDALEAGADTVIPWDITGPNLSCLIKSFFRRHSHYLTSNEEGRISFKGFVFHEKGRYLEYHQQKIKMPDKEFDVLQLLIKNAGKNIPTQYIFAHVWSTPYGDISTVGVHIKRLRQKLSKFDSYPFITNVYGVGYMFDSRVIDSF